MTTPHTVAIELYTSGELQKRASAGRALLSNCSLCPRNCGVNRLAGEQGFCQTGADAVVASYGPHFGEEQPLVGTGGSGTVFLASCSLRCCFCQNYEISFHPERYRSVDSHEFAAIMLNLQQQGCHNLNLVTPTHVVPQIIEALLVAIPHGLSVPLVYNCSGYESQTTLELLDGIVDIYLSDFKFWDSRRSTKYAGAPDYREHACRALTEMHRQVGDLLLGPEGLAFRGLLVRHLVMPAGTEDTGKILHYLATAISTNTHLNLMDQYHPSGNCGNAPELQHPLTSGEYRLALDLAAEAGLHRLDRRDLAMMLKRLNLF